MGAGRGGAEVGAGRGAACREEAVACTPRGQGLGNTRERCRGAGTGEGTPWRKGWTWLPTVAEIPCPLLVTESLILRPVLFLPSSTTSGIVLQDYGDPIPGKPGPGPGEGEAMGRRRSMVSDGFTPSARARATDHAH